MADKKTKKLMETLEKEKRKRARNKKGHFVADDPNTPQNEAYIKSSGKVKVGLNAHINEATNKGKPIQRFFLVRWYEYLVKKYLKFVDKTFGM